MIGLIRKDFINLKKYGKQIGIMLAAFLVFGIAMKSPLYVCFMMMLYGTMTILTAMAYDEKADFDKYALCLPVSRKDLVKSKYLVWFIIMFGAFSISSITGAVLNLIFQENILETFISVLVVWAAYIVLFSIVIPFMYRYGVERGRMIMIAVFVLPTVLVVIVANFASNLGVQLPIEKMLIFAQGNIPLLVFVGILLIIAAVSASYMSSVKIVKNKEY